MNSLLSETKEALSKHGYSLEDVESVQSEGLGMTVLHFMKLTENVYFEPMELGNPHVATDLVILMLDGSWFEREIGFDENKKAFERWAFRKKPPFEKPNNALVKQIIVPYGKAGKLKEINHLKK